MSFWNLSSGESAAETAEKEFDGGGGKPELVPDGSSVLAHPDDVKWATDRNDNEFLNVRWRIQKPVELVNRVVFQKLWITDDDPNAKDEAAAAKKRDKALKMLASIDANAGGKLARKAGRPSDDDLALALVNKAMVIRVGVYSFAGDKGETIEGNYIQAVSPKTAELKVGETAAPAPAKRAAAPRDDVDDDVPF